MCALTALVFTVWHGMAQRTCVGGIGTSFLTPSLSGTCAPEKRLESQCVNAEAKRRLRLLCRLRLRFRCSLADSRMLWHCTHFIQAGARVHARTHTHVQDAGACTFVGLNRQQWLGEVWNDRNRNRAVCVGSLTAAVNVRAAAHWLVNMAALQWLR